MAKQDSNLIPSVLAFEKKLVPSDGFLYGTTWAQRATATATPLKLIEKSVRGTISNRLKDKERNNALKLDAEIEKPNLQTVDTCALGEQQDTLKLSFTLKVLGNITQPSACNNELFAQSYAQIAQNYIDQYGFTELARRYAYNIANARFLWRNRVGAEAIEVHVKVNNDLNLTFDSLQFSLNDFEIVNADIEKLAQPIAQALCGTTSLTLEIVAYAHIGLAQEVYPSEELVLDKNKDKTKKSKILYDVNNVAALHSQKIGNALRTIDTWYPEYSDINQPIAIEPYGSVTNKGHAYRQPTKGTDFYSLFDQYALNTKLENADQEHYVMAILVRGGVFGLSGKD